MEDEVIRLYFEEMDRHKREASVAKLIRALNDHNSYTSNFGGHFVGYSHDSWPNEDGIPMEGVLQVIVSELPYTPSALTSIALLQVFASWEEWRGWASYNNRGWIVRTFESLEGLMPMKRPFNSLLQPCRINWEHVTNQIPSYPETISLIDQDLEDQFTSLNNWPNLLVDRYGSGVGTKIGGWPFSFQNGAVCGEYLIQVATEEKAHWSWGPNGNAFFGLQNGEWQMSWDFL